MAVALCRGDVSGYSVGSCFSSVWTSILSKKQVADRSCFADFRVCGGGKPGDVLGVDAYENAARPGARFRFRIENRPAPTFHRQAREKAAVLLAGSYCGFARDSLLLLPGTRVVVGTRKQRETLRHFLPGHFRNVVIAPSITVSATEGRNFVREGTWHAQPRQAASGRACRWFSSSANMVSVYALSLSALQITFKPYCTCR